MKKFFMIAVMAVAALTANAQSNACQEVGSVSIKPYVGLSMAEYLNKNSNTDMRTGFTVGAEAQYMTNEWFGLSAGVAYSQQGAKRKQYKSTSVDYTQQLDYINIPILANFYVCKGLALKIGVQPGFVVNKKAKLSSSSASVSVDNVMDDFRSFDFAIPVGISYEFSQIVIDARVNCGVIGLDKNYDSTDEYNPTNGVFQLTVGYRF